MIHNKKPNKLDIYRHEKSTFKNDKKKQTKKSKEQHRNEEMIGIYNNN